LSGGRAIELAASRSTDPQAFEFPMVMAHYRDCNFSMAGVKNCVYRQIVRQEKLHGTVRFYSGQPI
jgi:N6-L-threonylcarbamoyladenine synthase